MPSWPSPGSYQQGGAEPPPREPYKGEDQDQKGSGIGNASGTHGGNLGSGDFSAISNGGNGRAGSQRSAAAPQRFGVSRSGRK